MMGTVILSEFEVIRRGGERRRVKEFRYCNDLSGCSAAFSPGDDVRFVACTSTRRQCKRALAHSCRPPFRLMLLSCCFGISPAPVNCSEYMSPLRGLGLLLKLFPGFRYASPWAIHWSPLAGLSTIVLLTFPRSKVSDINLQAVKKRPKWLISMLRQASAQLQQLERSA